MRKYIDMAHFRTPYNSPNLTLTGLGTPDEMLVAWPQGRGYFDVSRFRNPYRDGFFQDNSLFGLGADGAPLRPMDADQAQALAKHGPEFYGTFLAGKGQPPSTLGRELESTSAQIPQWAWLTGAAVAAVVAYRSYRSTRRK